MRQGEIKAGPDLNSHARLYLTPINGRVRGRSNAQSAKQHGDAIQAASHDTHTHTRTHSAGGLGGRGASGCLRDRILTIHSKLPSAPSCYENGTISALLIRK